MPLAQFAGKARKIRRSASQETCHHTEDKPDGDVSGDRNDDVDGINSAAFNEIAL